MILDSPRFDILELLTLLYAESRRTEKLKKKTRCGEQGIEENLRERTGF